MDAEIGARPQLTLPLNSPTDLSSSSATLTTLHALPHKIYQSLTSSSATLTTSSGLVLLNSGRSHSQGQRTDLSLIRLSASR